MRRGQYIGTRVAEQPTDESEHFDRCPTCGGLVDLRDLANVLAHAGLPHPAEVNLRPQPSPLGRGLGREGGVITRRSKSATLKGTIEYISRYSF